ncbi:hypothetical protein AVEN_222705-1 [Araneus ventricosus]|uniref:ribonuclease H n=1 Tax=Araneus ventricosus TaxID=182803 RepID=A0A4Y2AZI9_ARAVE|nr:hypothetical protein AVEN_222705-1 [Araneus ventricosus]
MELQSGAFTDQLESKGSLTPSEDHTCLLLQEHTEPHQPRHSRWRGITSGTRIYTDGSKTEKGVGAAFCVWSGQNIVYRWLAKQQDYNTVFQAEFLALKHATDHATSLPHHPVTILVDNQASVQAAANPRSINTTARAISKSLITGKHIHISWIKADVGYDGNEEVDRLAKEAEESDRDPLSVKAPIFFLKSIFKKKWRTSS